VPTSKLTSKGQITVPKSIRDQLGLEQGDTLEFVMTDRAELVVRVHRRGASFVGSLHDFAPAAPVTVEEMRAAVRRRASAEMQRTSR